MRLRLSRGQFTNHVNIYASTLTHTDAEKGDFYVQTTHVLQSTTCKDRLLQLVDFNSRVGRDSSNWKKIFGPFGSANDNGLRLMSVCAAFAPSITNTWFVPVTLMQLLGFIHVVDMGILSTTSSFDSRT